MKMLSKKQVSELTGLSRSTIDRLRARGLFPQARKASPGRVVFLEDEIEAWRLTLPHVVGDTTHAPEL
ncbi:helix-turn-helix transcriptional regulator [Hyphomicrobium album]|nr:AlpA family phage regulatory protein [Hyphomicrobium album]